MKPGDILITPASDHYLSLRISANSVHHLSLSRGNSVFLCTRSEELLATYSEEDGWTQEKNNVITPFVQSDNFKFGRLNNGQDTSLSQKALDALDDMCVYIEQFVEPDVEAHKQWVEHEGFYSIQPERTPWDYFFEGEDTTAEEYFSDEESPSDVISRIHEICFFFWIEASINKAGLLP